jgi:hypothetical protein
MNFEQLKVGAKFRLLEPPCRTDHWDNTWNGPVFIKLSNGGDRWDTGELRGRFVEFENLHKPERWYVRGRGWVCEFATRVQKIGRKRHRR